MKHDKYPAICKKNENYNEENKPSTNNNHKILQTNEKPSLNNNHKTLQTNDETITNTDDPITSCVITKKMVEKVNIINLI